MVLNTDIAPLNLSISQSDVVKDMVDECSALLEELQMCGASFVVQPKAVQTDVETMIHIEKYKNNLSLIIYVIIYIVYTMKHHHSRI